MSNVVHEVTSPDVSSARLQEEGASGALVTVQRGHGDRLPFFCVHGAGGNVINFRGLACRIDPGQPFYALQAAGVDGVLRPQGSIEQMASAYLDEMRKRQPRGPYLLGGYSGGGIVAYELAQRLSADGEPIALLALIDTMHPRTPVPTVTWRDRLDRLRAERVTYLMQAVRRRAKEARQAKHLRDVEAHLRRDETIPFALRDVHVTQHFRRVAAAYAPVPWRGRAVLFRAERMLPQYLSAGPTYGWDRYALGGVGIVPVPGDHWTLLDAQNVDGLAQALSGAISRATSVAH